MKSVKSLSGLNELENLQVVVKTGGERRRVGGVNDDITTELALAETPAAVGKIALRFGITEAEIIERGRNAPNFGQFRMVVGNRIRGTIARAAKSRPGRWAEAAYPGSPNAGRSGGKVPSRLPRVSAQNVGRAAARRMKRSVH